MDGKREFIVTLLFGWLGIHRFMKKQYILGVIYLFTLGGFLIGWLIDVLIAFSKLSKPFTTPVVVTSDLTNTSFVSNMTEMPEDPFPTARYDNAIDMFKNIYHSSSKQYKETSDEYFFIDSFIAALTSNNLPCCCLLSRMSNGELVVYYKNLEIGRFKLNGSRRYLTVAHNVSKHYESKTMNFYISKMKQYWIPNILHYISTGYVK